MFVWRKGKGRSKRGRRKEKRREIRDERFVKREREETSGVKTEERKDGEGGRCERVRKAKRYARREREEYWSERGRKIEGREGGRKGTKEEKKIDRQGGCFLSTATLTAV